MPDNTHGPEQLVPAMVMVCFLWAGCSHSDPPETPATPATKPSAQPGEFTAQKWAVSWARGEKGKRPEWAGGAEVLSWPQGVPDDIMPRWAKQRGIAGLSESEIRSRLGRPVRVLANESVGAKLLLYDGSGCIYILEGKCDGWAPRSPNYEKYFLQPDL